MQTGASLESLAKGVVSFSRRYSLKELRERWHSVLYDSDVSDEVAVAMNNLELAKSNGNGTKELVAAPKRKTQTIRKVYNAMRKRLRTEVFFNSFDMALCDDMCIEKYTNGNEIGGSGNVNCSLDKDVNKNSLVSSLVKEWNQLGLVGARAGSSHSMNEDPIRKMIEDGPESKEMIPHVSDTLLNSPKGEKLVLMNIDEKDETAADKQSDANVDSNLLPSLCDIGESQKLVAETQLAMANGPSAMLEVVANSSGSSHGDVGFPSDCENKVPSSGALQKSDPKPANEFRLCSFNTEDPNIPSPSDDSNRAKESDVIPNSENISAIVVPSSINLTAVVVPNSVNISTALVPNSPIPKPISIVKEVGYPDSSITNLTKKEPDEGLKRKDTLSSSFAASQSFRPGLGPNINSSKGNSVAAVPKIENSATMKHASSGHPAPEVRWVNCWILHN